MTSRRRLSLLSPCMLCGSLFAATASAQVDVAPALRSLDGSALPRIFADRVSLLTTEPLPGAVKAADGWFRLSRTGDEIGRIAAERPGVPLWWAPPRRLLLDRVDGWTRAGEFRNTTGLRGQGVVIGIIDSGVDPSHPDLRTADGKSRVRWWLDYSRPAAGRQPELEAEFGCGPELDCAIFSGDDLDELLANDVPADEPRDTFGHGTHVASLAAGNGLSNDPPKYVGVAPEATLIVVRVARSGGGGIQDADVVQAARFVFERAEALSMPAVVNMSLGSDFGGHDGSSALEQGLDSLVGSEYPGRALVVAAGNSAGLFTGAEVGLPEPLGVHTEVHVPSSSPALVPIFTANVSDEVSGTIYVWVGSEVGDSLEVGVDDDDGPWFEPIAPGNAGTMKQGEVEVTVINQAPTADLTRGSHGAVVVIDGSWPTAETFSLRLSGRGTASLWLQSEGGLAPEVSAGALLPRAFKEGTINVPASSAEMIAVGATLNRSDWVDYEGNPVSLPAHGALDMAPLDTTAFYSSAGPNQLGLIKPDIVAPGANVIGAMTAFADPRADASIGIFGSLGRCPATAADECFVVDDFHAVSGGTSMSAPIVAGAIALLLERDPTLTQPEARALLQAGARPLEGAIFSEQQAGPGALDLTGALLAAIADDSPAERLPSSQSWIALARSYARPDPDQPLRGFVELRDEAGAPADAFEPARLELVVTSGSVLEPLRRLAAGLYDFAVSTPAGSGGGTLELAVHFDGDVVASQRIPIAVDHHVAEQGVAARGGCAVGSAGTGWGFAPALLLLGFSRRRRVTQSRAR